MIFDIRHTLSKSMLLVSMLLFFCLNFSYSQKIERSHAITNISSSQPDVPDTLTIIAVRVEFQKDGNRFTSGNGTFETGNPAYLDKGGITIDPLPHDRSYFESHLQFAKNYFEKVSGKQLTMEYRVLPEIYPLPNKMERYAPTGEAFTSEKIARLTKDTWQVVEQHGGFPTADLDPKKTAFAIFHAGVGRDIELTGTTLDKTPQDIPSLFLDQKNLVKLLGDPNFDGFDINGGAFKITNSMVLPRTLSRRGEDITGSEYVLQLSINGLLCASIGSYLGLPDLFNTQTGSSGIGRFGLMDGESFFSYRGLFPPEPSAWEKIFLGWQTPFSVSTGIGAPISLPAATSHQNGSIAKYELSPDEYFLLENRHRDPDNKGVTLTFRQPDGSVQTKHFDNDDEAFVNQAEGLTETLIPGVVTDVSNFDWSLPGGLDPGPDETAGTTDDRYLNGGILVWHIDEAVIEKELDSRSVNITADRRGVDLEEADGAQDIGRAASGDFDRQARGTAFDFWWEGNNASVITLEGDTLSFYENRFGPDTRPSNESNSGAPGLFEFYDFSDNKPVASFRIRSLTQNGIGSLTLPEKTIGDSTTYVPRENVYLSSYPLGLSLFKAQTDSFLIIPSRQSTYALKLTGGSNPLFDFQFEKPQQPYLGSSLILGERPMNDKIELASWQWDGLNWNSSWNIRAESNDAFLSSVDDQTLLLDFTNQRIDISNGSFQAPLTDARQRSASLEGRVSVLSGKNLTLIPDNRSYAVAPTGNRNYTGALPLSRDKAGFYFLTDNKLMIFEADNFDQPNTVVQNIPMGWPAFTDIDNDGQVDFIYVNKETHALEARNLNGALIVNFPIAPPPGGRFVGTPLIAKSEHTNKPDIYIPTQDSLSMNISAYTAEGNPIEGFPLYVGGTSKQDNLPVHPVFREKTLYAVSHRGELKAWQLDSITDVLWGSQYGNAPHNKISGNVIATNTRPASPNAKILNKSETYNWPNPAENFTNLRFQTREAGHVDVQIITAGGNIVFNKRYRTRGGLPEERRISTQNWSSGLYFAMITATVSGKKARKMIKIVIVH